MIKQGIKSDLGVVSQISFMILIVALVSRTAGDSCLRPFKSSKRFLKIDNLPDESVKQEENSAKKG